MKNTAVFNDFDMVVSITEKTINDQLTHLLRMGTIHPELIILQDVDDAGAYKFTVCDSTDDLDFDKDGNPPSAAIAVEIKPQVSISSSGKIITFILKFVGGYAWFWKGTGPRAKLVKYEAAGWQYGVTVNMDLKQLSKDRLEKDVRVPGFVEDQLNDFMENMFDVSHLFMNFQSTDLMKFNPEETNAGAAKDQGVEQLVIFMNFYLKWLTESGNPFILGYSITQNDKTQVPDESKVPDSIKPTGTTYTMFRDNLYPHLSTLNFTLVTKGGHKVVSRSPDNFDTNWISPDDQCDAKMIYAASRFSEEFIFKPLFQKLCNETYEKVKTGLSLRPKRGYEEARQLTSTGYKFVISDQNDDSDKYLNDFEVKINNHPGEIHYDVKGRIFTYKGATKDMGFCTARASAEALTEWSAKLILKVIKNEKGEPVLKFEQQTKVDKHTSSTDTNTCADVFNFLGDLLKIITPIFDLIGLGLSKLLDDIFKTQVGGVLDISVALANMDDSFNSAVMLPAGGVFFFKNPVADTAANLSLSLTYKTDSAVRAATQRFQQQFQGLKSIRKYNLALMGSAVPADAIEVEEE
jgi:hypothetical protein